MSRAKKVCARQGCPTITTNRLCPQHAREADKARGTSTQRGYGTHHINARAALAPQVATGTVPCVRCGQLIAAGDPWHLDHNDQRTSYLGPSHAHCNLSAAGKAAHQYD
ncbi:hypothetical protein RM50_12310 [Pseudarthrobacter phenanthrenivorans]|uniref:HNH endonuclease n=1 Tax=Pseudarthrobacter phenanthrenivorans TaxID=361575 RepID=A0A0B4DPH3_PSEPS|nr:hypothetical protein RM50_12310 [Pseudarthrobacter phenanthrenivorans]